LSFGSNREEGNEAGDLTQDDTTKLSAKEVGLNSLDSLMIAMIAILAKIRRTSSSERECLIDSRGTAFEVGSFEQVTGSRDRFFQ
jgi:hypothetical protein